MYECFHKHQSLRELNQLQLTSFTFWGVNIPILPVLQILLGVCLLLSQEHLALLKDLLQWWLVSTSIHVISCDSDGCSRCIRHLSATGAPSLHLPLDCLTASLLEGWASSQFSMSFRWCILVDVAVVSFSVSLWLLVQCFIHVIPHVTWTRHYTKYNWHSWSVFLASP
jgi:hypothetical protein